MQYPNQTIEELILRFRPVIGKDYNRYRNHVYRVFNNCMLIDPDKTDEEKYAIAAVFQDIGIWTNHTFDYLEPSVEQAILYLSENEKKEWIEEISLMIYWHHKIREYHGVHEKTVENFRKADWVDISFGLTNFGLDKQKIKECRQKLPDMGFHFFLLKISAINFFSHPLKPLPMARA